MLISTCSLYTYDTLSELPWEAKRKHVYLIPAGDFSAQAGSREDGDAEKRLGPCGMQDEEGEFIHHTSGGQEGGRDEKGGVVDKFRSPREGKFIYHPRGEGGGGREERAVR